jgi:hypothetical protein
MGLLQLGNTEVLDGAANRVSLGIKNAGAGPNDDLGSYHDGLVLTAFGNPCRVLWQIVWGINYNLLMLAQIW